MDTHQCHTLHVNEEVRALWSKFRSMASFRFESCDFSEKASNYPLFFVCDSMHHTRMLLNHPWIPAHLRCIKAAAQLLAGEVSSGTQVPWLSLAVVLNLLLLVSIASAGHHYGGSVTFSPKGTNADGSMRVRIYFLFLFKMCGITQPNTALH